MLNLIITCDDPTERLLYGESDPWLAQFECRHDVGYQHHHNVVNPPTGPGGPQPPDPPDPPDPPTSTPSTPRPPPPPPPPPEPSQADIDDWRDRQQTGEPSQSLAESVWRGQQAGREAEEQGSDNPAVDRVQQSGAERAQRQEEIDRARFDPTSEYDVEEGLRQLRDLTNRAPGDPDAEWHDELLELYETYADAWEAEGLSDMRLTDGQGNAITLGEYLADQRSRLAVWRNVRRTLGTIDDILSTTDAGDVAELQALADDPATADLPITVAGPDGAPVQTTVGDHITDTLIPRVQRSIYTDGDITPQNAPAAWNSNLDAVKEAVDTLNDPNATPEQLQQAAATLSGLADAFDGSGFERSWDHDNDEATPEQPITAAEKLRKWASYAGDRAGSIYTDGDITEDNAGSAWNSNLDTVTGALDTLNDPNATPGATPASGRHPERAGRRLRRQRF